MEDINSDIDGENLIFSKNQIHYLRSEFERQRRWVNLLSTREQAALEELERTQNSVSYRIGRFLTALPRAQSKDCVREDGHCYFTSEDSEQRRTVSSSLLITPELLPTGEASRGVASFIEEILI